MTAASAPLKFSIPERFITPAQPLTFELDNVQVDHDFANGEAVIGDYENSNAYVAIFISKDQYDEVRKTVDDRILDFMFKHRYDLLRWGDRVRAKSEMIFMYEGIARGPTGDDRFFVMAKPPQAIPESIHHLARVEFKVNRVVLTDRIGVLVDIVSAVCGTVLF